MESEMLSKLLMVLLGLVRKVEKLLDVNASSMLIYIKC